MSHESDQSSLPKQGRLTAHIGTSENDDLLFILIKLDVIGNITFADRQVSFNHGIPIMKLRLFVLVLDGIVSKTGDAIHNG